MTERPPYREPVEWLASEFASRFRRGERPTVAEYMMRYPEYARQIEMLFPVVAMLEGLRDREVNQRHTEVQTSVEKEN